eukprot:TRINITY_DN25304_c0_g1_i1.p1 TRINITY_DN25304_c0_g1~~TRINITY_DN25304_c0_g1_i1.p1  ORF type:complete len:446 (-),score=75.98 TRINITY_DN25304_c0_g1_i1:211-1548(-)
MGVPSCSSWRMRQLPDVSRLARSTLRRKVFRGKVGYLSVSLVLALYAARHRGCDFIRWSGLPRLLGPRQQPPTSRLSLSVSAGDEQQAALGVGPAEMQTLSGQKAQYLLQENPEIFDDALEREFTQLGELRRQWMSTKSTANLNTSPASDSSSTAPSSLRTPVNETASDGQASSGEAALRTRMAELGREQNKVAAAELMYLTVCDKFRRLQTPLISSLRRGGYIRFDVLEPCALTSCVHSPAALKAVEEHVAKSFNFEMVPREQVLQIPLVTVGQAYAMSSLFGYVLRRAERRYRLEQAMGGGSEKSLQDYLSSYGPGKWQDKVNTVEAQLLSESQVQALFGDLPALKQQVADVLRAANPTDDRAVQEEYRQAVTRGDIPSVSFYPADFRHLLLEACAFGAITNEVEHQVPTLFGYELTPTHSSSFDQFAVDTDDNGNPVLPPKK